MNRGNAVYEDAIRFCEGLKNQYNIYMHRVEQPGVFAFVGEYYSMQGTPFRISVAVYPERTEVRILRLNRECLYQKAYITKADKKALTNSVGVVNFINRSIRTL